MTWLLWHLLCTTSVPSDQRRHGLRVIPVLTDGVVLPTEDGLPDDITGLSRRQYVQQLPAAVAHFAGRVGELATLTGLLRSRADAGGTVVIYELDDLTSLVA